MDEGAIYLKRECQATIIPMGDVVMLEKGCAVIVRQALGNSVTVDSPNGLFRIAREDLDALGEENKAELEESMRASAAGASNVDTDQPFSEAQVWEVLKQCFVQPILIFE